MTGVFCVVFDLNIGLHIIVQELRRLFQRRIDERPDTHEQETVKSSGHTLAHHHTHRAAVLEQILAQRIEVRSGAGEVDTHETFDTHVFKNIDNHRGIIMEKIFERDRSPWLVAQAVSHDRPVHVCIGLEVRKLDVPAFVVDIAAQVSPLFLSHIRGEGDLQDIAVLVLSAPCRCIELVRC